MESSEELKEKIRPILKKWGVEKAAIFGSYVRGKAQKGSDVDILVEIDEELSLIDLIELKIQIEDSIGKKVDLVEYSTIKPALKERILEEQETII